MKILDACISAYATLFQMFCAICVGIVIIVTTPLWIIPYLIYKKRSNNNDR